MGKGGQLMDLSAFTLHSAPSPRIQQEHPMQYDRTFSSAEAAHEWAKAEGFETYKITSKNEPILEPLPMGQQRWISNMRYFIHYDE